MSLVKDVEFLEQVDAEPLMELHRSNLLRLQTTQLLEELPWQPSTKVLDFVQQIADYITNLSSNPKKHIALVTETPFPSFVDQSSNFESRSSTSSAQYLPPLQCKLASPASLSLWTKASGNAHVPPTLQVHVTIPNSFFASKDYLKHRYFQKRNCVVWTVARCLHKAPFLAPSKDTLLPDEKKVVASAAAQLCWSYQHGDSRKPILILLQSKFRVCITFGMQSHQWIPTLRLLPNRNNVGSSSLGRHSESDGGSGSSSSSLASPHYNQVLIEDVYETKVTSLSEHHGASSDDDVTHSPIIQAAILAKIWCLQRGLFRGHDSMTETQLHKLMEYLVRTKRINARLTPTQIVAAWFKFLVETNWMGDVATYLSSSKDSTTTTDDNNKIRKAPSEAYRTLLMDTIMGTTKRTVLVLPHEGSSSEAQTIQNSEVAHLYAEQTRQSPLTTHDPPTLLELYQQTTPLHGGYAAVMLDSTMTYNYLHRWSPSFVRTLQREAHKSLKHMFSPTAFDYLFLTEARFWTRYDAYLRIRLSDIQSTPQPNPFWGNDRHDVGEYESLARGMLHILSLALGDRVHEVRILTTGNGSIVRDGATKGMEDSDEIPRWPVSTKKDTKRHLQHEERLRSPTGSEFLVIGLTLNSDTCTRIVDRGPPAEDTKSTEAFVTLWGSAKAQLRRFKDGAIVHAVVWDAIPDEDENVGDSPYIRFENDDKNGGIVERIVRHIVRLHFHGNPKSSPSGLQFSLRGILSAIDGVQQRETEDEASLALKRFSPLTAHRMVVKAYDALAQFLRKHSMRTETVPGTSDLVSRLGIPLSIDAVEALSPALRYADVFPPVPHPLLGTSPATLVKDNNIPGAVMSEPIEIQIRFGPSSKWPTDLRAIGAAKSAMLVRMIEGMEAMKASGAPGASHFYGHSYVTSSYADIGWMGYVFRIRVRADPELKLLRGLNKPSDDAATLLRTLTKQHVVSPTHHTLLLSVYNSHPSASAVTRLAKRWLASHFLSGHFPFEAIELLVASVYTNRDTPLDRPGSVVTGFLRFLRLLGSHDWAREPLIVDPHDALSSDDRKKITKQFERVRGPDFARGPALYVISPCDTWESEDSKIPDQIWTPTFTTLIPEAVVLARAAKLAERSHLFLQQSLRDFTMEDWSAAFSESKASFHSYSALLRVHSGFVVDSVSTSTDCDLGVRAPSNSTLTSSYTMSMQHRWKGPKELEFKAYRNISERREDGNVILHWNPVDSMVQSLTTQFSRYALIFYNEYCPKVIAVLWRPHIKEPRAFSAMVSEYARPVTSDDWKADTLVTLNVHDLLREMSLVTSDIVTDAKLLDAGLTIAPPIQQRKRKQPPSPQSARDSSSRSSGSSSSSSDSESEQNSSSDDDGIQ